MRLHGKQGFTLIELMISVVVMGLTVGSIAMVNFSTTHSIETSAKVGELSETTRAALAKILERVETANADQITPTPVAPFHASRVDFVRASAYADGETSWSDLERIEFQYSDSDPDDGIDNDQNGLVDDGLVVRIERPGLDGEKTYVLCRNVPEYLEGETFDGRDNNGNGLTDETGLCFEFVGNMLTMRLSTATQVSGGMLVWETRECSIALRNGD